MQMNTSGFSSQMHFGVLRQFFAHILLVNPERRKLVRNLANIINDHLIKTIAAHLGLNECKETMKTRDFKKNECRFIQRNKSSTKHRVGPRGALPGQHLGIDGGGVGAEMREWSCGTKNATWFLKAFFGENLNNCGIPFGSGSRSVCYASLAAMGNVAFRNVASRQLPAEAADLRGLLRGEQRVVRRELLQQLHAPRVEPHRRPHEQRHAVRQLGVGPEDEPAALRPPCGEARLGICTRLRGSVYNI